MTADQRINTTGINTIWQNSTDYRDDSDQRISWQEINRLSLAGYTMTIDYYRVGTHPGKAWKMI